MGSGGTSREYVMPRRRKRAWKASVKEDQRSFGSGLDDVGWKPASGSFRVKPPRMEKTIEQVRAEFYKALSDIAAERRFGGSNVHSTELEILEEATKLVKEALRTR